MTSNEFNEWRVVPRILLLVSAIIGLEIGHWYMFILGDKATTEQTAFASAVVLAIVGLWTKYLSTGGMPK
ncbi:MAG: hypothetical protein KAQ89_07310 [Planctomycetes bacterium]|nr:hypothetical protein [Planctomycetota bacterium]